MRKPPLPPFSKLLAYYARPSRDSALVSGLRVLERAGRVSGGAFRRGDSSEGKEDAFGSVSGCSWAGGTALSLQQTHKQGPPAPRPLPEFLPSTMLKRGFQDSELEMRPQEGRERSQYLPWGRRRGSGTIPSAKSLGADGSLTVLAQRQDQGLVSPLPQASKGVIDTP